MSAPRSKHPLNADKMVRYCPECGHIGPVGLPALTCCPDSFGMSVRRWQAEKMNLLLGDLRATIAKATATPTPDMASRQ